MQNRIRIGDSVTTNADAEVRLKAYETSITKDLRGNVVDVWKCPDCGDLCKVTLTKEIGGKTVEMTVTLPTVFVEHVVN